MFGGPAWSEPKLPDEQCPGSCATRTFTHAGLRNTFCDSVATKTALIKPPLDAALPKQLLTT